MRQDIWNKKIPTILGMLFLVAGIGMTSFFAQRSTSLFSQADSNDQPIAVRISNQTDTSATISFTTATSTIATLSYGTNGQLDQVITDTRDQQSAPSEYQTHLFTLQGLTPGTLYSFTITSSGNSYDNEGQPFQFTTGQKLANQTQPTFSVSGKIITPAGEVAKGVLVYLSGDTLQELTTLTGIDGAFSFSLDNMRGKNIEEAARLEPTSFLTLLAMNGTQTSQVIFLLKEANPIPTVTLANDYDFTTTTIPFSQTPESSSAARITFPFLTSQAINSDVQIITPKKGQEFTETKPLFQGTAKANETVEITIQNTQARVISNQQGQWSYRPTTSLTAGNHTITIKAEDNKGILQTSTQSFTVRIPGGQTSQRVVPTKTPTPTLKAMITPTPTIIALATTSPPTPTTVLVAAATSPTPTTASLTTQTPIPLEAGNPVILSLGFLAGLIGIIGTGLFFLSSKAQFV